MTWQSSHSDAAPGASADVRQDNTSDDGLGEAPTRQRQACLPNIADLEVLNEVSQIVRP